MSSTIAPIDLAEEIKALNLQLLRAEAARISDADRHVQEIRAQLANKQAEFAREQEAEAADQAAQQRARDLQTLAQLENDINTAKAETVALRRELDELPQRLSRKHYELGQLLRQRAQLKLDLGI
jgi:hypothetical protein